MVPTMNTAYSLEINTSKWENINHNLARVGQDHV